MFYGTEISKTLYLLRYCRLEPNLRFYYVEEKQWSSMATIFGIRCAAVASSWESKAFSHLFIAGGR